MEEFLKKVWLEVYLKAMEIKVNPVEAANRAVLEARKTIEGNTNNK